MSNSFQKVEKIDPFNDAALGEWKPNKKASNKDFLAFVRSAEINIPEAYAQKWIDPITFDAKWIWGKTMLTEHKLINKMNSEESVQREMYPSIKGGKVKPVI